MNQQKIITYSFKRLEDRYLINPFAQKDCVTESFLDSDQQVGNIQKSILKKAANTCFIGLKLKIILILCLLFIVVFPLFQQLEIISEFKTLKQFQQDGFSFLKYFPVVPILVMGCVQKYYAYTFPNQAQFNPENYQDSLSALNIFGNDYYIGKIINDNSPYYTKQKKYFFQNPCRYKPDLLIPLGVNSSFCQTTANSSFKQGLSSFLRYCQRLGQKCIRGTKNFTSLEINEFTLQGRILSAYVIDSIDTWITEFSERTISIADKCVRRFFVLLISIAIVYLIVMQRILIKGLEKQYEMSKRIYRKFVTDNVLKNEKILLHQLVEINMIQK